MTNDEKKFTKRELRIAAVRALKVVMKSAEKEPSTIIFTAEPKGGLETEMNEITEWLFHRRQKDGNKRT